MLSFHSGTADSLLEEKVWKAFLHHTGFAYMKILCVEMPKITIMNFWIHGHTAIYWISEITDRHITDLQCRWQRIQYTHNFVFSLKLTPLGVLLNLIWESGICFIRKLKFIIQKYNILDHIIDCHFLLQIPIPCNLNFALPERSTTSIHGYVPAVIYNTKRA